MHTNIEHLRKMIQEDLDEKEDSRLDYSGKIERLIEKLVDEKDLDGMKRKYTVKEWPDGYALHDADSGESIVTGSIDGEEIYQYLEHQYTEKREKELTNP